MVSFHGSALLAATKVTVVTICREPLAVTLRFLSWHRALGADEIHLYLDDPNDPVLPLVANTDWVKVTRCDDAFWQSLGLTPETEFARRQVAALTFGYRAVTDGWVAILDADELFHFSGQSFHDVLAPQPTGVRAVRVPTAEHVESGPDVEDGLVHFRLPMSKAAASTVYGAAARLFRPTEGLIGHRVGKSLTRAGLKIRRMRPHWAAMGKERDITDRFLGPDEGAFLLHMIQSDYAGWRAKLAWRLNSSGGLFHRVKAELQGVLALPESEVEGALATLFATLYCMDRATLQGLAAERRHLALPVDLFSVAGRYFPQAALA